MTEKHTGGEWYADGRAILSKGLDDYPVEIGCTHRITSTVEERNITQEEAIANAYLFAKSPLLPGIATELRNFLRWWDEWKASDDPTSIEDLDLTDARDLIARWEAKP